jgi:hypothetical protein
MFEEVLCGLEKNGFWGSGFCGCMVPVLFCILVAGEVVNKKPQLVIKQPRLSKHAL